MPKLTLDDLDVRGKRVLVRVDFNVPLLLGEHGQFAVSDDTRIRASLPTIRAITSAGGKAILLSHLGRPKGQPDPRFSLAPVADHLNVALGEHVRFVSDTVGDEVHKTVRSMPGGSVLLLENTRFFAGETKNDPLFAAQLASLGDVFVNDAFGAAHRAHASNVGVASRMDFAAAGYLLQRELAHLSRALATRDRPVVALLGGAKVSDKLGVIAHLATIADAVLIGGAMSYTFLKALGHAIGESLVDEERLDEALAIHRSAEGKIFLPTDHVAAETMDAAPDVSAGAIGKGLMGLDIGPVTVEAYRKKIVSARTVLWNGPMGVFEVPRFAAGTQAMAKAMVEATEAGAITIVGGGDSVAAITQAGYAEAVTHISTGGGAMLEFLEGRTLPGLAALTDKV